MLLSTNAHQILDKQEPPSVVTEIEYRSSTFWFPKKNFTKIPHNYSEDRWPSGDQSLSSVVKKLANWVENTGRCIDLVFIDFWFVALVDPSVLANLALDLSRKSRTLPAPSTSTHLLFVHYSSCFFLWFHVVSSTSGICLHQQQMLRRGKGVVEGIALP